MGACYTCVHGEGLQAFPSVKTDALEWVLVDRNRKAELEELRSRYRYSPLDLKEVLPPLQRPKVVARDGYIFMILLYPMFNRVTREVHATEVDFFYFAATFSGRQRGRI